jgi:dethiobiotin synthetase
VADLYLGSINHTLLTIHLLSSRGYPVKGIIFNGEPNPESERVILQHSNYPCLLRINKERIVDIQTVKKYGAVLKESWK